MSRSGLLMCRCIVTRGEAVRMRCDMGQGFLSWAQSQHIDRDGGPLFVLFSPWKKGSLFAQVGVADVAAHARHENAAFGALAVIDRAGCGAR